MHQRSQYIVLKRRLEAEPRRFIQVILGPRQVGKTTLALQLQKDLSIPSHFLTADALIPLSPASLEQTWTKARLDLKKSGASEYLLIVDEVQKIEQWSEIVKREWDEDTRRSIPIKLVLLGSSRLLIQKGLTESLAGRFEILRMGHWLYSEMSRSFGFTPEEYVWFGGYPGAAGLRDDEVRWKTYVRDALIETSVSRDILMMTRVDKPILLRRLFETGCLYSGQIVSLTKILGQLLDAGNTTTLSHYLELLDQSGLLAGLQKYSPNTIRKRASSPKFQVYNTALMSAQSIETFQTIQQHPTQWGHWVESAVGMHLINLAFENNLELNYWREGNNEIDFVLQLRNRVIGIEVKSGQQRPGAGYQAFRQKFNPDKILLVGPRGISWKDFLMFSMEDLEE